MKQIVSASELGLLPASRLLVVMPHPDDESEFCGGFLAKAALENIHITLLCLSKGEASTLRHGLNKNHDLGKVRQIELLNAAKILGIQDTHTYDFPDGKITSSVESVKSVISHHLKKHSPQMILTLEPNGIYGHPDHIAVTKAVVDVYAKSDKKSKLTYVTVGERYNPNVGARKMVGRDVVVTKPSHILKMHPVVSEKKFKALSAHMSQFKMDEKQIGNFNKMQMLKNEFLVV